MASQVSYVFVDKVPEDYQCSICTNILTNPVLIECCGQHFCEVCLEKWLAKQQTCPHCRDTSVKYIKNRHIQRNINGLRIYCSYRPKGCSKISTIGDYASHLTECLFVEVVCGNQCGKAVIRKDLKHHINTECPNRKVKCVYCQEVGMHKDITTDTHQGTCPSYPLPCSNNCGALRIERQDVEAHKESCPLEPVKCPFFHAGCTDLIPRKKLEAHSTSNTQNHLMKLAIHSFTTAQQLESVTKATHTLQQKFDTLASCVSEEIKSIRANPDNTPKALKRISSTLDSVTTMMEIWKTYCLRFTWLDETTARCPSFYVKPGYKMFMKVVVTECQMTGWGRKQGSNVVKGTSIRLYLEKGEYDNELTWPIPEEFNIELVPTPEPQQTEVKIVGEMEICARCGLNLNQTKDEREIQHCPCYLSLIGLKRTLYFNVTIEKHEHSDFGRLLIPFSRKTRECDF